MLFFSFNSLFSSRESINKIAASKTSLFKDNILGSLSLSGQPSLILSALFDKDHLVIVIAPTLRFASGRLAQSAVGAVLNDLVLRYSLIVFV